MVKVLTQEEALESRIKEDLEISNWWNNLRHSDKKWIYNHYKDIFKHRDCQHLHRRNINFYDIVIEQCDDCGYITKDKDPLIIERDKKLKNILIDNEDKK